MINYTIDYSRYDHMDWNMSYDHIEHRIDYSRYDHMNWDMSFLDVTTTDDENPKNKNVINTKDITKDLLFECEELNTCTICLEEECKTKTTCEHYFHTECLSKWLMENKDYTCPNCRKELL